MNQCGGEVRALVEKVRERYRNYLRTSFFFRDPALRASFGTALAREGELLKGPYAEEGRTFLLGETARAMAREQFGSECSSLEPALVAAPLYWHQERAVRLATLEGRNVIVATGTASGKTECFLYPILFELYRQHLRKELTEPGVRALILYPMNALANDQRERLGRLCGDLRRAGSDFAPTFGQYIGETPERPGAAEALPGELVSRQQMRDVPPHILLSNYSMLEYLLMRPKDSPLFDGGRSKWWQFLVLDEAHQYRGARGMELGMLLRRLKQRLRGGGRKGRFQCIGTSATISSGAGRAERAAVAAFGTALFGEQVEAESVVFERRSEAGPGSGARRCHAFVRALEGAFLVHRDGTDSVVLNRGAGGEGGAERSVPMEIALCRECGQHYYVGQEDKGRLAEAIRDPSHACFGVNYYLPTRGNGATHVLCRRCGALAAHNLGCGCERAAKLPVQHCKPDPARPDQLSECEVCEYRRGSLGDPVQEIVHGSDGPNAVIATALHQTLPAGRPRKVLAFADSRQEAAFFAWYAQDSYETVRNRNLILRAMREGGIAPEGLSVGDLAERLARQWEAAELFSAADTRESRRRKVRAAVLAEALTDERRLSLEGVGLLAWTVTVPQDLRWPPGILAPLRGLAEAEASRLLEVLLDQQLRLTRALALPERPGWPSWAEVARWPGQSFSFGPPRRRPKVVEWGGARSTMVSHYLPRLGESLIPKANGGWDFQAWMKDVWEAIQERDARQDTGARLFVAGTGRLNGTFRLNPDWMRVKLASPGDAWECTKCASMTTHNVRGVCPRPRCRGTLGPPDGQRMAENHYRLLYEDPDLPEKMVAEEHTAQIESKEARERQQRFKDGSTHLLSSSTTFEVGVDLGDLDVVFLRNVPPESFNYTQRVGRAGRRGRVGLALTYCRRNPHDLYHYADPQKRVIAGTVQVPRIRMGNEKVILRHMVAASLSAFFKASGNESRFSTVKDFLGDWKNPRAASDLRDFCRQDASITEALREIVPEEMHHGMGLETGDWIGRMCGEDSRLARIEAEAVSDYLRMEKWSEELFRERKNTGQAFKRMDTMAKERTLAFLSRKAVIPKYGFPVDVVELDTWGPAGSRVELQRDLSQAIAEYAPGGRVVANKLEWESYGVKRVAGREWRVLSYAYDNRSFSQWEAGDPESPRDARKYLIPEFGFVTERFVTEADAPKEPRGRARRYYTTRPFFRGFDSGDEPETDMICGVEVTKAQPGTLVVLCEGSKRKGFYICGSCGAQSATPKGKHRTPLRRECRGTVAQYSLGHELVTDVVRLVVPRVVEDWHAYSVGYALLLGASEALDVPGTDLNMTVTGKGRSGEPAIVLYDAVPGGAGLVAQLGQEHIFLRLLECTRERVGGACGCDASCYGCLRSYRNQFAHPYLDRLAAARTVESLVGRNGG